MDDTQVGNGASIWGTEEKGPGHGGREQTSEHYPLRRWGGWLKAMPPSLWQQRLEKSGGGEKQQWMGREVLCRELFTFLTDTGCQFRADVCKGGGGADVREAQREEQFISLEETQRGREMCEDRQGCSW